MQPTDGFEWNFSRTVLAMISPFSGLSCAIARINLPDITSLAGSGRPQNANVHKTDATGIEAHNSVTVCRKITSNDTLNLTECLPPSQAAFCLAPAIGGLLV